MGRENFGGAEGIRTLDLLDAIEARSQLRHGPTELQKFTILNCSLLRGNANCSHDHNATSRPLYNS